MGCHSVGFTVPGVTRVVLYVVMDGPAKRFGAFEEDIVLEGKGAESQAVKGM
jgi:hypothetical protein